MKLKYLYWIKNNQYLKCINFNINFLSPPWSIRNLINSQYQTDTSFCF